MSSPGPRFGSLSKVGATAIDVDLRLCLNRHHRDAGCQRCVQACPVEAVSGEAFIQIDLQKCVGWGVCASACPTDALSLATATEKRIWSRLIELARKEDVVTVACSAATPSGSPDEREVLELPCLAAASPVLLVAAAIVGTGRVLLDDSACGQCSLGSTRGQLLQTVDTAQRLLAAFGRKAEFPFAGPTAQTASPGEATASVPAGISVPSRGPVHSRRGLLRFFGIGAAGLVAQMTPALLHEPEQGQALAAQATPRDRARLADLLAPLTPSTAATVELGQLPTAQVDIGEECCACNLCPRFCPTAAIRSRTAGNTFELSFVPVYCVGCGICAKVCPAGSVALSGEVDAEGFARSQPQVLALVPVAPCASCGEPCAPTEPEPLCFACKKRAEQRRLG